MLASAGALMGMRQLGDSFSNFFHSLPPDTTHKRWNVKSFPRMIGVLPTVIVEAKPTEFLLNPGRHCVSTCPNGTLIEDEHCVARCSPGNFRNAQTDNKRCVPCPDGQCPRVCQLDEPLNADNIRTLANCSEIEGNIEILGYAFEEHLPPGIIQPFGPIAHSTPRLVPALNASQLEVLRSVRIVTGFVVVDGSKTRSRLKPNSLGFLENLEVIEGRRLYYEASANANYYLMELQKYALYVIGNPDLKWLGLRALRQIDTGLVSMQHNERLCYSHSVPFDRLLGVREYNWKDNMEPAKCEARNRKCDANCGLPLAKGTIFFPHHFQLLPGAVGAQGRANACVVPISARTGNACRIARTKAILWHSQHPNCANAATNNAGNAMARWPPNVRLVPTSNFGLPPIRRLGRNECCLAQRMALSTNVLPNARKTLSWPMASVFLAIRRAERVVRVQANCWVKAAATNANLR